MTKLERHIKAAALWEIRKLQPYIEEQAKHTTASTIVCTFRLDGVVDLLYYDVKERRFTKVEYQYATKGIVHTFAGTMCDEYETRTIEL